MSTGGFVRLAVAKVRTTILRWVGNMCHRMTMLGAFVTMGKRAAHGSMVAVGFRSG